MSLLADALDQLLDACPDVGSGADRLERGSFLFPAAFAEVPTEPSAPIELVTRVPFEP